MNADDVLQVIRTELATTREVSWGEPAPTKRGGQKGKPRPPRLSTVYPLLKLVPGRWLRLAPISSGAYHSQARAAGLEVTARHECGVEVLYLRAPEVGS
jgi:hypothetical protein